MSSEGSENHLPYEVNVISLNGSASVDSTVDQAITSLYPFGWFHIDLRTPAIPTGPLHQIVATGATSNGWPILGLTLDVNAGTSTGAFRWYGSTITNP
jgi:hypothetical protein